MTFFSNLGPKIAKYNMGQEYLSIRSIWKIIVKHV